MDREAALLLRCLLAAAEPAPALADLAAAARPQRFVRLARRWAVSENAAHALLAAGVLEALGTGAAEDLRGDLQDATARNALLLAEAVALQRALRAEGIECAALKGAALAAAWYPAVGARHVGDLDLLVHPGDALRAADVLRGLGCVPRAAPLPGLDGRPAGGLPVTHHHLPALWTPAGMICELHHGLPGVPGAAAATAGVLARAGDVPWRGASLRVPSLDDLLGVACAHVLGHHRANRRFLPRHVADVAVLLRAGADPARAGRLCPGGEVAASLDLLAAARGGRTSAILPRTGTWRPLARGRDTLASLSRSGRRGELLRLLFPARAYLASRYGVAPGSPLVPLLWVWRPIGALWRIAVRR